MSGKSITIGLILGLIIVLPIGYFLPQIVSNIQLLSSNPYAGYTQVKVPAFQGITNQVFGEYRYFFTYVPDVVVNGVEGGGYLSVDRENVVIGTQFDLTIGVSHDYYGITFAITEIHPEYCIVMAKLRT